MFYTTLALHRLIPNSEWHLVGDELTIITEGITAPTQSQINAMIEQIKQEEIQAETNKAAAKASAEAKLQALGLTADDLKALGL